VRPPSGWVAWICLVILVVDLLLDPAGTGSGAPLLGAIGALPLLVLLAAFARPGPKWGGWVAVVMVPYFTLGIGAVLTDAVAGVAAGSAAQLEAVFYSVVSLVAFFCGMASSRQLGAFRKAPAAPGES
jgi:uncharacterized membrane protein